MLLARHDVLAVLRRAGIYHLVEGKEEQLPDPVDTDRDEALLAGLGITHGRLMELMGSSP